MDIFGPETAGVWERIAYACLVRTRNPRLAVRFDRDDLYQEVRTTAIAEQAAFQGTTPEELEAWLGCLVQSRFCDQYRRHAEAQKRTVRREEMLEHYEAASRCLARSLAAPDPSPCRQAALNESALALRQAISELPEPDRTVVVMRRIYEATLQQIADWMGGTTASVNNVVLRALKVLSARLTKYRE